MSDIIVNLMYVYLKYLLEPIQLMKVIRRKMMMLDDDYYYDDDDDDYYYLIA